MKCSNPSTDSVHVLVTLGVLTLQEICPTTLVNPLLQKSPVLRFVAIQPLHIEKTLVTKMYYNVGQSIVAKSLNISGISAMVQEASSKKVKAHFFFSRQTEQEEEEKEQEEDEKEELNRREEEEEEEDGEESKLGNG